MSWFLSYAYPIPQPAGIGLKSGPSLYFWPDPQGLLNQRSILEVVVSALEVGKDLFFKGQHRLDRIF